VVHLMAMEDVLILAAMEFLISGAMNVLIKLVYL
jgi:hypothetical protein